jgi:ribosome maturation factor RimP
VIGVVCDSDEEIQIADTIIQTLFKIYFAKGTGFMPVFVFFYQRYDHNMNADCETNILQVVGIAANPILGQIWQLAEPLCQSEGLELVYVEYQREQGGRTLRFYLDKPGGITLDDCAAVSRQLSDLLDVSLEMQASYRLEVSSPGLKRPIGRIDDFRRFTGKQAKIRTQQAIDGQKNFTGVLDGVTANSVRMKTSKADINIAFDEIAKAHLLEFDDIQS